MYKLKSKAADFVVEEQIQLKLEDSGDYAYFWLSKKEYTTLRAVDRISVFLKKRARDVGFAGNKDKIAVTKQAISVKDPQRKLNESAFSTFNSDIVSLEYIGRGEKPISLGDLDGNRFRIVLRECNKEPRMIKQFVNYFDEQRFSETNVAVGRAIVKGDFEEACKQIKAAEVDEYVSSHPKDYVGAIKKLSLKTRMLYVNSYQSWLWNAAVSEYLQCKYDVVKVPYSLGELCFPQVSVPEMKVPIVGFGVGVGTGEVAESIKKMMEKERMVPRDFVIRSMPELSAEGGMREMMVEVRDLKIEKTGDREYTLNFFLPKGCYATMAVKQMMA